LSQTVSKLNSITVKVSDTFIA